MPHKLTPWYTFYHEYIGRKPPYYLFYKRVKYQWKTFEEAIRAEKKPKWTLETIEDFINSTNDKKKLRSLRTIRSILRKQKNYGWY